MKNDISILFSGGPDSTLAALKALDKADTVHLLTFHHKKMGKIGKHRKTSEELKKIFGNERVKTYEGDINNFFNKFYINNFKKNIVKYRSFYIPWICGACKLSMHLCAIQYNLKNNIKITYDGANKESAPYFMDQTIPYINVIKEFYKNKYDMIYDCPVFVIIDTDKQTEKYGVNCLINTKKEHFIFSTQHTCLNGVLVHLHSRLYYRPFRGKKRTENLSAEFLKNTINNCINLFP